MAHRFDDCRFYDRIKDHQAEQASLTGNKPSFNEALAYLFPDAHSRLVAGSPPARSHP